MTGRRWSGRSRRGRRRATAPVVVLIGASPLRMPASSSSTSTPQFRADKLLAAIVSGVLTADTASIPLALAGRGSESVVGGIESCRGYGNRSETSRERQQPRPSVVDLFLACSSGQTLTARRCRTAAVALWGHHRRDACPFCGHRPGQHPRTTANGTSGADEAARTALFDRFQRRQTIRVSFQVTAPGRGADHARGHRHPVRRHRNRTTIPLAWRRP